MNSLERDVLPLVEALTRNNYFERWIWNDAKVTQSDVAPVFANVLRRNQVLQELQWCHCTFPKDFLSQVLDPLQTNSLSRLSTLNFTGTLIDDKGNIDGPEI